MPRSLPRFARPAYIAATIGTIAVVWLGWFLLHSEHSPLAFFIAMRHVINQEERFLLYDIDHASLAQALRELADQRKWQRADLSASDPSIPAALKILKPSAIWIFEDRIELDFGGAFLSFGFRAFPHGVEGYGTKRLGDGFWFYSEDGRVPSYD